MPSGRTTGTAFTVMPTVNAKMAAMVEECMLKVVGRSWVELKEVRREEFGKERPAWNIELKMKMSDLQPARPMEWK